MFIINLFITEQHEIDVNIHLLESDYAGMIKLHNAGNYATIKREIDLCVLSQEKLQNT